MSSTQERWYTGIARYQWIVLLIALTGWMFDIFEGQIFVSSMNEVMPSLVDGSVDTEKMIPLYKNIAFSLFLAGGALGGVVFGVISDKIGRKRTMAFTILMYSFFTWTSAFSQQWWQFAAMRFLVALGVGGEWAIASAFVAEVFPDKARAQASSIFHASGTLGTLLAAAVGAFLIGNPAFIAWCKGPAMSWTNQYVDPASLPWRFGFTIGLIPALLVLFVRLYIHEPESWKHAKELAKTDAAQKTGVLTDLFRGELLRSTIIGVSLAAIGMATFWGVHVFGKDALLAVVKKQTVTTIIDENPQKYDQTTNDGQAALKAQLEEHQSKLKRWEMLGMVLLTVGLGIGQIYFGPLSQKIGRRAAFLVFHLGGFAITIIVFRFVHNVTPLLILLPVFGFLTAGMHAGYAVYFPELYPTRMRGTGTGFCFNAGRLLAVPILILTGWIQTWGISLAVAVTYLSFLYLLGPFVLYFARETKGQELLR
ncbi:MAG: MFS transporter [Planctomycetaceae bacterium]|jgi:MFS family permease|nr:MFS transporter [Planctomycetaceae bacterium]